MIQDTRPSSLPWQQISHLVADRQLQQELLRGYSFGCTKRRLQTLLEQYESPVTSIREEALDAMLELFCDAEPAQREGRQLAVEERGAAVLKRICAAMSQSTTNYDRRSTDDMLSLSTYEIKKGADLIHSLLLTVPPFTVTKLAPANAEPALHQVLMKTLMCEPEAAGPCLGALKVLVILHAEQRAAFIRSEAAKLCTLLGESALPEDALHRGMELLCTLAWHLRYSAEGDLEAKLLDASREVHLNACSVLSQLSDRTQLSGHALAQAAAQLQALL